MGIGLDGIRAIAHRLLDQGLAVIAWDRNREVRSRASEIAEPAQASEPAEVVDGAGVVITMLPTAEVVLDVVEPLLEIGPEGTIWLQMSSVGAAEADRAGRRSPKHTGSRSSMHPSRAARIPPRRAS